MSRLVPLRLGLFSTSLAVRVARDHDHFATYGLEVSEEPVASSRAQFTSLLAGDYDLVLTGPDNVLAYRLDPANPLGATHDVRIVAAIDRGLGLSLIGAPGIRRREDLRGKVVAVDVPDSGFAFVLYRILADAGLQRGTDYQVEAAGATPRRRAALLSGEFDATLLGAGHDVVAVRSGCSRLARAAHVIQPFLGTVLAGAGSWIDGNRETVQRFCGALSMAAGELVHPAGHSIAITATETHLRLTGAAAGDYYATLISPEEGLIADGRLDITALTEVARLRAAHGRLGGIEPDSTALLATGVVDGQ